MNVWPTAASRILRDGYTESPPDRIIEFRTDTGPRKTRVRTNSNSGMLEFAVLLSPSELATFKAFFNANAGLRFEFPDPFGGDTMIVKFMEKPTWVTDSLNFIATVKLEVLP